MTEKTIMRIEELDGVKEGDVVVVGLENVLSSCPPVEIFWAQTTRELYPFGGVITLSRKRGRQAIRETRYHFTVRNVIGFEKSVILSEEGTPRFYYYDAVLKKAQL